MTRADEEQAALIIQGTMRMVQGNGKQGWQLLNVTTGTATIFPF